MGDVVNFVAEREDYRDLFVDIAHCTITAGAQAENGLLAASLRSLRAAEHKIQIVSRAVEIDLKYLEAALDYENEDSD